MPCRCEEWENVTYPTDRTEFDNMKKELDQLTDFLCFLGKYAKFDQGVQNQLKFKQFKAWYEKHKEFDKKRLAAAKKNALAKLTTEEKEALGL
jgi:hypothetical protein